MFAVACFPFITEEEFFYLELHTISPREVTFLADDIGVEIDVGGELYKLKPAIDLCKLVKALHTTKRPNICLIYTQPSTLTRTCRKKQSLSITNQVPRLKSCLVYLMTDWRRYLNGTGISCHIQFAVLLKLRGELSQSGPNTALFPFLFSLQLSTVFSPVGILQKTELMLYMTLEVLSTNFQLIATVFRCTSTLPLFSNA